MSATKNGSKPPHSAVKTPLAVGIDSLYVSYFLDGLGIDWERLALEKERLQHDRVRTHSEIELGGESFALRRGAGRPYSYGLSNRAFTLKLGQRIAPNCHVQFHSELLWAVGLRGAVARFEKWYTALGASPTRNEVIARADFAFDFHVPKPDFSYANFLSQAEKDSEWRANRATQTFQFGKDQVVCRVYNKSAEIEEVSEKTWMFPIWGMRENVWRVEFQTRGERLKASGISNLAQLSAHAPCLVQTLATKHTAMKTRTRDSNASRWPLHPIWQGVLAATHRLAFGPMVPAFERHGPDDYSRDQQAKSVYGSLKGLAATLSATRPDNPLTFDDVVQILPRIMQWHHSDDIWRADVLEKLRKRELGL